MAIHIGIDVGSVSINTAVFSDAPEDAECLQRLTDGHGFQPPRQLHNGSDGHGRLSVGPYVRISGAPAAQAHAILERLLGGIGRAALGSIAGTGAGAEMLARAFQIEPVSEVRVVARAVEALLPGVRTLFEIGGETSKYVRFDNHGEGGRLRISDFNTNGDCAAGTGAFLDQQAGRLQFRIEDTGQIASTARRTAQIAGRCSVFAKSDMVHAQQRGFAPEEILKGLCEAVARNFKSSITRGRSLEREIAFVGGVAANSEVSRALERVFGWEPGTLLVPPEHASFGAIGAALLASDRARGSANSASPLVLTGDAPSAHQFPRAPALTLDNVLLLREHLTAKPTEELCGTVDAYLGIDIGSVSTNLVVIDGEGAVLKEMYLRTNARPIEVVASGLRGIQEALGDRIRICGVGTTGSGRELIAELIGADAVKDEITAHKTGAVILDKTLLGLGVDTIFEIGGQDAKFIGLQDGIVVDFAMNEACAAGTGSFLEERAKELGIRIEGEFAALAMSSDAPIQLGERCTVFMERDVNNRLRDGAELKDVVAGLALSVATNYINRVVRGRRIGEVVFFQGGTAYNDAVAAAMSAIIGKRVIVPPFNGVIGALGVAHLAREKMKDGRPTSFRGFAIDQVDYDMSEFTCKGCTNECQMQRFTIDGEQTYWGDKCAVRYRKAARSDRQPAIEDLVSLRERELTAGYNADAGSGPVIGLPFCLSTYDWAPFWLAVFKELDVRVLLSDPTNNQIAKRGLEATVAEPCFPVQVAHGHIRSLLEKGVDFVFVPNNISAPGDPLEKPSFFCPWNQTLPFVVRAAPFIFEHRHKVVAPTLWFNGGADVVAASLAEAFGAIGLRWRARQVQHAVQLGFEAMGRFQSLIAEAGRRALATLDETGEPGVVLLGRSYNIYDRGVSLDVATKLRKYYGANVLGFDFLAAEADGQRWHEDTMYWHSGARVLAAASFTRDRPNLHLIYITNFKCGPDSYVKHGVLNAAGRPFLTLQFDGHNNDAGILTRCEAYLESKGVLQ
jgi:predicted CoA-substrate-specific enzyme activase